MNTAPSLPPGTRVLVTGATGFTGSVLVKKLLAAGVKVRAIRRPSSNIQHLRDLDIDWIVGDVYDEETVKRACQGAEYIFHVAAAFREAKIRDIDYWNVHVRSTQLLAHEAKSNPNFKRFVHISTMGVHGHIDQPPATEEYRYAPGDPYQRTKLEAELWIRDFGKQHALPFTVVRPAGIYGPGDKRLLKVFRMASKSVVPILGSGKCLYHLIHVEDLTDAFIVAATHPNALGDYFICGNVESTSLEQMVRWVAGVLGTKPKFLRLPAWPFFALGLACEIICKPFGVEPPIYRRRVAFFTKDRSFNTSKIRQRLGWEPKFDNESGIIETAKWYQINGWL